MLVFHTGAEGSAIRVTSGTISGPATLTIDPGVVGDNAITVVIAGNLQVDGTQTTVNSTNITIDDDKNLVALLVLHLKSLPRMIVV